MGTTFIDINIAILAKSCCYYKPDGEDVASMKRTDKLSLL